MYIKIPLVARFHKKPKRPQILETGGKVKNKSLSCKKREGEVAEYFPWEQIPKLALICFTLVQNKSVPCISNVATEFDSNNFFAPQLSDIFRASAWIRDRFFFHLRVSKPILQRINSINSDFYRGQNQLFDFRAIENQQVRYQKL